MKTNDLIYFYLNPGFDKKFSGGIKKLNECLKAYPIKVKFIDDFFLKTNIPDKNKINKLVIVGGDGTLHKAINTIPEYLLEDYLFGVLPCGTANEFGKALNMPKDLKQACEVIVNGASKSKEHIGIVDDKYKFMTGILYGAPVMVSLGTSVNAKRFFGIKGFYSGFIKFVFSFLFNRNYLMKKFILNKKDIYTNFLMINNARLSSKDATVEELEFENKNKFSLIYFASNIKIVDILRLGIKHEFHKSILNDESVCFSKLKEIKLTFKGNIKLTLDGEYYDFKSPILIDFFNKKLLFISNNFK